MSCSASSFQRSPKRAQPMPRIATLSLIPLAISIALRGRNRFPEIFDEPAALVMRLDAEHHSHRRADVDARGIGIGEFDHHPPAAVELDHAVIIGRIGGVSEAIGGVSRSEEHTSKLQSLMRISYAVFCLKKKTHIST